MTQVEIALQFLRVTEPQRDRGTADAASAVDEVFQRKVTLSLRGQSRTPVPTNNVAKIPNRVSGGRGIPKQTHLTKSTLGRGCFRLFKIKIAVFQNDLCNFTPNVLGRVVGDAASVG